MTDDEFKTMRKAFPWSEQVMPNGVIHIRDRLGQVVPLLTVIGFCKFITNKLAKEGGNAGEHDGR
ncbi:hypothetical protein ACODYM_29400 [Burkholderia gladioli]|uniref:hypothetical protein n=1 Tax=Burkholderia gladioli TaxID=28095 RepID=UPI003B5152E3